MVKLPFSPLHVRLIDSSLHGVYVLWRGTRCVFVGGGSLRKKLESHLNGDNFLITEAHPTHFFIEVLSKDSSWREKETIAQLSPYLNKSMKN